jgi:predicted ArsR family transcriptional regulator
LPVNRIGRGYHGGARDRGRRLGDEARRRAGLRAFRAALLTAIRAILDEEGYEIRHDPGGLTLANCPFRVLAREYIAVVCGMNLAIMEGMAKQVGQLRLTARLDPAEGRCCVRHAVDGSAA